jgi:hypothetical protein
VRIQTGIDSNDDGVLSSAEVMQTQYVCNGLAGPSDAGVGDEVAGGDTGMDTAGGGDVVGGSATPVPTDLGGKSVTNFGTSISMSGNTAIVGTAALGSSPDGAAYVFVRNLGLWSQQARLVPDDGSNLNLFGSPVTISGDSAVVRGGFGVYVFERSGETWAPRAMLTNSRAMYAGSHASLAMTDDTLVVGSPGLPGMSGSTEHLVIVYSRTGTTWTETSILQPPANAATTAFGYDVSISGDTLLVCAPDQTFFGAYVFVRSNGVWSQEARLQVGDPVSGLQLPCSVSVAGDTAIIGSPTTRAAYVFVRNNGVWMNQAKLSLSDNSSSCFGTSIGISGDLAVVGAPSCSNKVFVFARTGTAWNLQATLGAPAGAAATAYFGLGMASVGDTWLIGAPGYDSDSSDSIVGTVFSYELSAP